MPGESPLDMMRPPRQRVRRPAAGPARGRGPWPIVVLAALVIVLALGWVWGWYYAASIAERTLAGWVERETAAGRIYSCDAQAIGGFPLRVETRCVEPAARVNSYQPPFTIRAKDVTFAAQVYEPTLLVGEIAGPLTLAVADEAPSYLADWSRARLAVRGLPPYPESVSVTLDRPRLHRVSGAADAAAGNRELMFMADHADLQGRITAGSPRNRPVIEAVMHLEAMSAPTLHPLVAEPIEGEITAVLRGFKDLSPKSWPERFREMAATGGGVDIKYLRIARTDSIVVGTGTLRVNARGKLEVLVRLAIVGIENIVPRLGIDRLIGRGVERLTGAEGAGQGFGALDRLVPGLGGSVRDTANATLIENFKKMGEPTEIDNKPAILLPLRFSDGTVYLGMVPLADLPPLF